MPSKENYCLQVLNLQQKPVIWRAFCCFSELAEHYKQKTLPNGRVFCEYKALNLYSSRFSLAT
jgi:hypothetical protein